MENEQNMPFQSEGGCVLDFSKMFSMILKPNLFNYFLKFFTLNKFYRLWDSAVVAFEIIQNE
jgi:hypothetical protein